MNQNFIYATLMLISFHVTAIAQSWKVYPYHEENSELFFPTDEGWHPNEPIEWWYTNARVTGETTGTEYSFMLTYFYFPALSFDGFRIFNIANETEGTFFDETLPCNYPTLAEDHLNIQAFVFGAGTESWVTKRDTQGALLPFQYRISAGGQHGAIDLEFNTLKRPLMVGDTGFLYQGIDNYTYYYSQTEVEVSGTLTIQGFSETVTGVAWIDRQWGNFNPNTGEQYEWFSLQLSNDTDINLWNIFTTQNEIPDTATYRYLSAYINDSTSVTVSNFNMDRLGYIWMPDGQVCYSRQWRLTATSPVMDLIITTRHDDHEVALPFRFYEGTTYVEGTFEGQPVTGHGFAELLRHYDHPDIEFLIPNSNNPWDASIPITWQLLDPDDGRPIYYKLEVSNDDKETFTVIADSLTTSEFLWNPVGYSPDSFYWFRLTGYSIDGTLISTILTEVPQMILSSGDRGFHEEIKAEIFPNPTSDKLTIDFEGSVIGEVLIRVSDLAGHSVKTESYNYIGQPIQLPLSGLPAGSYFLEIQAQGKSFWRKIILF